MKFSSAVLTGLLSASAVMAAPGTAARRSKAEKRATARGVMSKPMIPANSSAIVVNGPNEVQTEYSTNWAGVALTGTGYTGVVGTITAPSATAPSGGSSRTSYSGSAWVGIDGYTCETAILQTGIDWTVEDGEVTYDAWYEWYPAYAYDFSGISISEGDELTFTIKATSDKAGTATIENVTTGKSVTETFSNESDELCEYNAEWIVEDFEESDGSSEEEVAFADFGTVTFTGCSATDSSGSVGVSDGTVIEMVSSNGETVITAVTVESSSEIVLKYE